MIQRKQTLYLLLAAVLTIVVMVLPIGRFEAATMGDSVQLYALGLVGTSGAFVLGIPSFLLAISVFTLCVGLYCIFQYKNRKLQMRLCVLNMYGMALWYACFYYVGYVADTHIGTTFRPELMAVCPAILAILYFMAWRGIKADEELIRSTDRIR